MSILLSRGSSSLCVASSSRSTVSSSSCLPRRLLSTKISHSTSSSTFSAYHIVPLSSLPRSTSRRLHRLTNRYISKSTSDHARRWVATRSSSSSEASTPPGIVSELSAPSPSLTKPIKAPPTILDKVLPSWAKRVKPYLLLTRIDKPIGSILLYWPCAWSITMAATVNHLPPTVPAFYMSLFALGALVMRGAGCTINDMWDRKFDAAVERTQWRPLAAGDITPFQALVFLGGQLSVGLAVLTQLNWYSIVLGASSLGLVAIYPFMKRVTYYPHFILGLAFNWGAFLGWSAVTGSTDWLITLPMYVGGTLWCVMYDIIYAHQDKRDDILIGVKSMALRFPDTSRSVISGLSASFVGLMTTTGYLAGLGPWYYAISCAGSALHLGWQCKTVNFDDRKDLWSKFCSNGWLGGLIWAGVAADYASRVVIPGLY